ncbi:MAG: molecular chaperone DnaJ [Candidatus Altimarinota bacterium]
MQYEYYSILEIERTATADEIKRAYKKKAMELHPDRHGGDKEKEAQFKKVNEAYATLSDEQKKAHYDRFGTTEGMGGFGGFQGGFDASDLGDIFSQFFGGGFSNAGRKHADIGEDIEIRMNISLEDAIKGNTRKVEFKRRTLCGSCQGYGGTTKTCESCGGNGRVRERVQTVFGTMEQTRNCGVCHGTGKQIIEKCSVCHGKKYEDVSIKKDIDIPAGIENGMSIKLRDEGHGGRDGNGDLYITFDVPDREGGLERDGANLHYIVKLSPALAVLGGRLDIEIPILGKRALEIKHGTSSGETLKFRDEGFPRLDRRGMKGDLIIHYEIDIPTKLSSEEKKLYTALLELESGKKMEKGFFEGIFE